MDRTERAGVASDMDGFFLITKTLRQPKLWCAFGLIPLVSLLPSFPASSVSDIDPLNTSLVAALGPIRPFEARLAGQSTYLPLDTKVEVFYGIIRGRKSPRKIESSQWNDAASSIRRAQGQHRRNPTPRSLRDQAVLLLLRKEERLNDSAIPLLQKAVADDPQDAHLWNDLAVVYLASTRPDPPGMFLAITAADRALQQDPTLPEARFNLALALEKSALYHHARRAWADYLQIDSRSGWAHEAREHLKRLRKPSPRERWKRRLREGTLLNGPLPTVTYAVSQIAFEEVTEELLGGWSLLLSEGRVADAQMKLDLAQKIGSYFAEGRGDKTVPDAVQAILAATKNGKTTQIRKAHRAYLHGMRNLRSGMIELAQKELEIAADLFASTGSPLEHWANLALAEIAYQRAEFRLLEHLLGRIRSRANLARYAGLNTRLFWVEGQSSLSRADFKSAYAAFKSVSMARFGMGDRELRGAAELKLAEALKGLGESEWFHRNAAHHNLAASPDSPHLGEFFRSLASVLSEDHSWLALILLNEGLEIVRQSGDPSVELRFLLDRAPLMRKRGKDDEARRELFSVEQKVRNLEDRGTRQKLETQVEVARCQVFDELDRAECLASVDKAIDLFRRYDRGKLPDLYNLRESYARMLVDVFVRERNLLGSISLYESRLSPYNPPLVRAPEAERSLDELTDLYLSQGDLRRALEIQERGRVTILPSPPKAGRQASLGWGGNLRPFSAREFVSTMPNATTLIEYQVRQEQVTAWVFSGKNVRRIELPATRQQLVDHVGYKPPEKTRYIGGTFASTELSRWLLEPLLSLLPVNGSLVFLPDPIFDHVGFERLAHPATRRPIGHDLGVGGIAKPDSEFTTGGDLKNALSLLRRTLAREGFAEEAADRKVLTTTSIIDSLPDDVTLVEYAFLGERLTAWTVSRGTLGFQSLGSRAQIMKSIQDLARSRQSAQEEGTTKFLSDLYLHIIPADLPRQGKIVIVPDDLLSKVPFAALRNPQSGRYFVEDHSFSLSPSASLYLQQSARHVSSQQDHGSWSFLAVDNPILKSRRQGISRLSGAAFETERIRRLFPGTDVISDEEEDATAFYSMAVKHEAVHFAGHWGPLYQTYGGELGADNLPIGDQVRLVVLAACSTASSGPRAEKTDLGLAEPLLARGVPAVVASLWDVEDEATSRLLTLFYEHFRAGKDAASALRAAQLDLLRGKDLALRAPAKWASFQVFGYGEL